MVSVTIKTRGGTAAEWAAANPTLADREPGYETDTHIMKIGDGVTAYNTLVGTTIDPALLKLDDLGAPDDNTDLNASATKHGLMNKLDNDATHFFRGDGTWTVVNIDGGAP